jgi:hypothetical protein
VAGLEPTRDGLAGSNDSGTASTNTAVPDAAAFEAAFSVLRIIPEQGGAKFLYARNVNPSDAWCRLAVDRLHDSLWKTLGHFLEGERSNEALSQMALLLFQNSSKPLREDFTDPEEWYEAFSGINFRWESIGILFGYWTFGATSLLENGNVEQCKSLGDHNRRKLMQMYKGGTTKCLDLCRLANSNNTMMVFLIHMSSLTASLITGDTGKLYYMLYYSNEFVMRSCLTVQPRCGILASACRSRRHGHLSGSPHTSVVRLPARRIGSCSGEAKDLFCRLRY